MTCLYNTWNSLISLFLAATWFSIHLASILLLSGSSLLGWPSHSSQYWRDMSNLALWTENVSPQKVLQRYIFLPTICTTCNWFSYGPILLKVPSGLILIFTKCNSIICKHHPKWSPRNIFSLFIILSERYDFDPCSCCCLLLAMLVSSIFFCR